MNKYFLRLVNLVTNQSYHEIKYFSLQRLPTNRLYPFFQKKAKVSLGNDDDDDDDDDDDELFCDDRFSESFVFFVALTSK